MDLDTRARQASHSLREVVDTATTSDDLVVPLRPRLPRRPVAAAALALVAGGLALFATTSDDDPDAQSVIAGEGVGEGEGVAGPVPLMVADPVPEGLHLEMVIERPADIPPIDYALFGDPDADRPFAGGDLGVLVNDADPGDAGDTVGPEALDESAIGDTGRNGRTLAWTTDDRRRVEVTSYSLSDEELLAAARALDPADPTGPPTGALPDGLRPVVSSSTSGVGTVTSYGDDASRLEIVAHRDEPGMMALLEWNLGPRSTEVEIDGRPGILVGGGPISAECATGAPECPAEPGSSATVVWSERDDLLVVVRAEGLDEAGLLALAEGVRPATPAERAAAPASGSGIGPGAGGIGGGQEVASGRSGDVEWRLTVAPVEDAPGSPEVCVEFEGGSSCTGYFPEEQAWEPLDEIGQRTVADDDTVVWGRAGADVALVRIEAEGVPPLEVETVGADGFADRFYAIPTGRSAGEVTIVALDASGTELGRRTETLYPSPTPGSGG